MRHEELATEGFKTKINSRAVWTHINLLNLAIKMQNKPLTQVAKETGIPTGVISYILSGDRSMSVLNAHRFTKVLPGLTAADLLHGQVNYQLEKYESKTRI